MHADNVATIYSANDKDRSEALDRNMARADALVQSVSKVVSNPSAIPEYYEDRAQKASKTFAVYYDNGNLIGAETAAGQTLYDIGTTAGLTPGIVNFSTKVDNQANKVIVEIHCDSVSGPHMHITDTYGNVYDKHLNNVTAKLRKNNPNWHARKLQDKVERLPEAHIKIKEFVELNMSLKNA